MPHDQSPLWEDLKQLIGSVVAEMNGAADLRSKTGGLECHIGEGETIVVSKTSFPQMFVAVRLGADTVDVSSRLVLSGLEQTGLEFFESLAINVDDSGTSLRSPEGDVFTTDQAVYHILRPFLHIGTVGC